MINKRMPAKRWEYIKQLRPDEGTYIVGGPYASPRTLVRRSTQLRREDEGRKALARHEVDAGY